MTKKKEETEKSFEYCMKELDRILAEIENQEIQSLDKFLANYEYGATLINKCEKILASATMRIKKISDLTTHHDHDEE